MVLELVLESLSVGTFFEFGNGVFEFHIFLGKSMNKFEGVRQFLDMCGETEFILFAFSEYGVEGLTFLDA